MYFAQLCKIARGERRIYVSLLAESSRCCAGAARFDMQKFYLYKPVSVYS